MNKLIIYILLFSSLHLVAQAPIELIPQKGQGGYIKGSEFSNDDKTLLTYNENAVILWDFISGLQFAEIKSTEGIHVVRAINDERFAIGYDSGLLEIRDLKSGKLIASMSFEASIKDLSTIIGSHDELLIASNDVFKINFKNNTKSEVSSGRYFKIHQDQLTNEWKFLSMDGAVDILSENFSHKNSHQIKKKNLHNAFWGDLIDHSYFKNLEFDKCCFSDKHNMLFYLGDQEIAAFDLNQGNTIFSERTYYFGELFTSIDVSDNKNEILASTNTGDIYVYDLANIKFKTRIKTQHKSRVNQVKYSTSGEYFVTSSNDYSSFLWDQNKRKEIKRLYSKTFAVTAVAFSNDGMQFATGDETGRFFITDLRGEKSLFSSERVSMTSIHDLLFDWNDSLVITSSYNNELIAYNVFTNSYHIVSNNGVLKKFKNAKKSARLETCFKLSVSTKSHFLSAGRYINKDPLIMNLKEESMFKDYDFLSKKNDGALNGTEQIFFSTDESKLFIVIGNGAFRNAGKIAVFSRNASNKYIFDHHIELAGSKVTHAEVFDEQYLIALTDNGQIVKANIKSNQFNILIGEAEKFHYSAAEDKLFYTLQNNLMIRDLNSTEPDVVLYNSSYIHDFDIDTKRDRLITACHDGAVRIWSINKGALILSIYSFGTLNQIMVTPDNYYMSNSRDVNGIGFRADDRIFPPEQFDLKFNRPDIVLERLGYVDSSLVDAYYMAYQKRLGKMGFTEEMLADDFHLPELHIENLESFEEKTNLSTIDLDINLADTKYNLDRINLWINDVAIYGSKGIPLREFETNSLKKTISIELAKGYNKVQVSVLNQSGAESYKETLEIECTAGKESSDLYIVTLGVSNYKDADFKLNYPAKDAEDMISVFEKNKYFKNIYSKSLTNEEVILENLASLKAFLMQADINDQVIVFVSGHGVLDSKFDYYYGSYDMDFFAPAERGIPYEALESLLDGIKSLRKLLFMDTCHSGEVDKDEIQETEGDNEEQNGNILFRDGGVSIENKDNPLGLGNTSEFMKNHFTDLRKGTGATVISSSAGIEFSLEGDEWNNGLFTYCLINGLTNKKADLNKDKMVTVSELQLYVQTEVNRLSDGKQTPTSRIENNILDYQVW